MKRAKKCGTFVVLAVAFVLAFARLQEPDERLVGSKVGKLGSRSQAEKVLVLRHKDIVEEKVACVGI